MEAPWACQNRWKWRCGFGLQSLLPAIVCCAGREQPAPSAGTGTVNAASNAEIENQTSALKPYGGALAKEGPTVLDGSAPLE